MERIKKKKKRPLKASFKRLLGNRIISLKQNCDCLQEVNAGEGAPLPPFPPPPTPPTWEEAPGPSTKGLPGWLTELPARNFKIHVSRNFLTGNFQSTVSLLNGAAPQEFVLTPSGSLREVSEVPRGGIAAPEGPAAPGPKLLWPPLPRNSPGGLICP